MQTIDSYISATWYSLERTTKQLAEAAVDPKLGELEQYPVYIPASVDFDTVKAVLTQSLNPDDLARIQLRVLSTEEIDDPSRLVQHGLLYLPKPYQVPGGRFNEMYGWDSYFINLGLLRSGQYERARWMVENHLYQVEHYGKVLNANRTYYLTRSQPPFLSSMVLDFYDHRPDKEWLKNGLPGLEKTYRFWTSAPHQIEEVGLSRYYDLGDGPAPEVLAGECDDDGHSHYDRIRDVFRDMAHLSPEERAAQLGYPLELYYDARTDELTPLFYKGDRTMRESGFDPSDRFGRFNLDVIHYAPVDLNCLLYQFELDMSRISDLLGDTEGKERWRALAQRRAERMQELFWDAEEGLFFDYDFRTRSVRKYPFATTFFPLYYGWATPEQASSLAQKLPEFLKPGGVVTSFHRSGNQWDYPFGWAPLQMVAALGFQRYGFHSQARAIAEAFVGMINDDYRRTGTILEKYDVVERTSAVSEGIDFGYSSNETGFGWTNGVYLVLKELLAD